MKSKFIFIHSNQIVLLYYTTYETSTSVNNLYLKYTQKFVQLCQTGYPSFGGLDYFGTIFVDTDADNDFIGLVFGYQSSSKFYLVTWKKAGQVYWDYKPFIAHSKTGLSIKVHTLSASSGYEHNLSSTCTYKKLHTQTCARITTRT